MEYNNPNEIVKTLTFGNEANSQIIAGVEKLANAVKSTLGASGKCVIYEDALGRPVITKDGVTVAESVVLLHPVENIGATLIKEAARNTVREAGDGTTTSTVLAHSLLKIANKHLDEEKVRELKAGIITDKDKGTAVLDDPYVLIVSSPIPNIRKIQSVLEHVIKTQKSLLIVASVEQQPYATLLSNKVKGNIKVNVVDVPGFGPTRQETMEDLALLTGATIINEELGDDLDLIDPEVLGSAVKAVTDDKSTVLQISDEIDITERVADVTSKLEAETNPFFRKKLEQRLSMLTGKVGIVYVGADSAVELKEKKDRVEDAVHATKAAYKEGIVAGGGIALLNAANTLKPKNKGEEILFEAIKSPYYTILDNAGIVEIKKPSIKNRGIDVKTGKEVNMITAGIIDPVLVTKSALKNAVSVVTTIISADCVISNKRLA